MRNASPVLPLLILLLAGCGQQNAEPEVLAPTQPDSGAAQASIEEFFTRSTDRWVEGNPNQAIASGYFSGEKQAQLKRQLTPLTRDFQLQRNAQMRDVLAELAALDLDQANPVQKRAADLLRQQLNLNLESEPNLDEIDFPLNQMDGAAVNLANALAVVHPLNSADDAASYVARLQLVDERMQEAVAESASRTERGFVMPAFIVRTSIAQLQQFISTPASENPFVTALAQKTAQLSDLTPEQRSDLLQQAEQIVTAEIYPAWQAAIAELERELPLATDDEGLWRFPRGADVYQQQLRRYTTTDLSAEEIHAIGLREVARLEAEMIAEFDKLGITEGTIVERTAELSVRTAYSKDEAGRQQATADIQAYLADALVRAAALFDPVPRTPVIAQPFPEFRWETAAANYTAAPLDGSRPGIYQFPLRDNELMRFDKRSVVYHETVPGHHFQMSTIAENKELPRFMQIRAFGGISAITEGWALYAERLVDEAGWYEGDTEGRLGYLDAAMWRARRLVVDTGLHAMRWTRQQAIDYGLPPSEIDRYIVWPGQACSYMIGMLKIVELREKARTALGDKFSLQQFHNVVLGAGVVPLTMLEQIVDEYIASEAGQSGV